MFPSSFATTESGETYPSRFAEMFMSPSLEFVAKILSKSIEYVANLPCNFALLELDSLFRDISVDSIPASV